jgi:HAD superfamily hydrolase (TIGR01509 family)
VIFDFDGVILETEMPEYIAWREMCQEYGVDLPMAVWATTVGRTPFEVFNPYDYVEQQIGRPIDRQVAEAKYHQRHQELLMKQPILPGVEEHLKEARRLGLKLGVASSSSHEWVHGHLKRLGLHDYFDAIRTADDVERAKPDPDLYLAALEALGVAPEEAFAIEDSPVGITAARRAGLVCVAVPSVLTRQLDTSHANLHVDSLADVTLEELIRRVQSVDGRKRIE